MTLNNGIVDIKKQRGIALLMMVVVLVISFSIFYFSGISIIEVKVNSIANTHTELKRAKQALLDYALINWRTTGNEGKIGKLPCPDYIDGAPNEGSQDSPCGIAYANAIGFFPWRTLGIDVPKDSSANCLLYVVSPAYKSNPVATLNPDSFGQIQIVDVTGNVVQGITPEERPVAVIISPGDVLGGQVRTFDGNSICGKDYASTAAYLDNDGTTDNAAIDPATDNIIEVLVSSYAGSEDWDNANPLNDRLITITHQEFWDVLGDSIAGAYSATASFNDRMTVLTEALAVCLANYGNNNNRYLPMPALLNLGGANEYRKTINYEDSGVFAQGYSGRLPYNVKRANDNLANGNKDILFKNSYCDALNLPVSGATVWLTDPAPPPGFDTLEGEYFELWRNWKDHFYYVISKSHNPSATAPANDCSGVCIDVGGTKYAGIVYFSGLKDGVSQTRYAPPLDAAFVRTDLDANNIDDKDDVRNYLEDDIANFPAYTGNPSVVSFPANDGSWSFSSPLTGNDIRFCVTPTMTVVTC